MIDADAMKNVDHPYRGYVIRHLRVRMDTSGYRADVLSESPNLLNQLGRSWFVDHNSFDGAIEQAKRHIDEILR
jgi:hypothetical protein